MEGINIKKHRDSSPRISQRKIRVAWMEDGGHGDRKKNIGKKMDK